MITLFQVPLLPWQNDRGGACWILIAVCLVTKTGALGACFWQCKPFGFDFDPYRQGTTQTPEMMLKKMKCSVYTQYIALEPSMLRLSEWESRRVQLSDYTVWQTLFFILNQGYLPCQYCQYFTIHHCSSLSWTDYFCLQIIFPNVTASIVQTVGRWLVAYVYEANRCCTICSMKIKTNHRSLHETF